MHATVFTAPITVRVKLCSHTPARRAEVFKFAFSRDKHTTVQKLLHAVAESYREKRGEDLGDLENRRLVMHLSKKGVVVGGVLGADADVRGLGGVQGHGWFGQMKIE